MVREPVSLQHLEACRVPKDRSYLLPDMAFAFKGAPKSKSQAWLSSQNIIASDISPLLGITVIDWAAQNPGFKYQNEYEGAINTLVQHFIHKYHGLVIFFPQCWGPTVFEDDRIPAKRIAAQVGESSDPILVVEKPIEPRIIEIDLCKNGCVPGHPHAFQYFCA